MTFATVVNTLSSGVKRTRTVRNLEPFYCPAKKTGKQIVATRLERCGA